MPIVPVTITSAGVVPRQPAIILAELVARVAATNPGYTVNLPGALIEDISSTDVAAILECDSALVDMLNSLTPVGANAFLLAQLGQLLGVPIGVGSNTSVFVQFSGPAGFVIGKGTIVSDGTFRYVLQDGGVIKEDGESSQLFALADVAGTWAVPAGTVTQLVTQPPSGIILSVVNPQPGVPGTGSETETAYRSRVLQANLAASQGMSRYLRTLLGKVSGVQQRLIATQQQPDGGWLIIVGGGDQYEVAYAIMQSLGAGISTLTGSTLFISGITLANPAKVTTFLNHGYSAGEDIEISASDPSDYNGDYAVLGVVNQKEFTLGKRYPAVLLTAASWAGGEITFTTAVDHDVTVGSEFTIVGCSPDGYNGTFTAIAGTVDDTLICNASNPGANTVLGQLSAGIANFSSVGMPAYVEGAILTPNLRNIEVSINDYPDTYVIPYVNPPQQTVTMTVEWDTSSPNFVSAAAVAQLAAPAIAAYINTVVVGQPISLISLADTFQEAVADVLNRELISVLNFDISINGIGTAPSPGSQYVSGDPESYFFAVESGISVTQI